MKQFRALAAIIVASSALAVAGCAPADVIETAVPTPTPSVSVDPFGPKPDFFPDGTAVDNKPLFDWVLGHAVLIDAVDPGKAMAKALIAEGFLAKNMQLTRSKTGTGKPADSVVISVQIGSSCLMGQRMADKSYYSTIESALKSGGCLIGEKREVTW